MAAARTQRKPTRRRRAPSRRAPVRANRTLLASRPSLRGLLVLEPHQVDVLALAIVAAGIFLGGVTYLHWAGGTLGHGAVTALRFVVGRLAYAVPPALLICGALILARDLRPPQRPLRAGSLCIVLALPLAFAAGTLGLGPGPTPAGGFLATRILEARGGVLGSAEFWVAEHLLSGAGADILAVFLMIAGVILLSGATFASVILAGRHHATMALQRSERTLAGRRPATAAARARSGEASAGGIDPPFEFPDEAAGETQFVLSGPHGGEQPPLTLDGLEDGELTPSEETPDDPGEGAQAGEAGTSGRARSEREELTGEEAGETAVSRPRVSDAELTPRGRYRSSVTESPEFVWRVPAPRMLVRSSAEQMRPDTAGQEQVARQLIEALGHFGVEAKVTGRVTGPHITRYELRLAPGIKVSKVANLKDDLAYALAATDIRILAPIPGKTAVGVEVPNARRKLVHLGDVFGRAPEDWSPLTVWLGKDIAGRAVGADLAKMPHLLVAGTTGAGKSACVNAMLCSVLMRATPHEVRLVLVDPKQVELNHYDSIPHLLTPVITSPRMAANALQNLVREMEQRYGTMSLAKTRSLPELNRVREGRGEAPLPYILCVIDELADLMMVAPADVEDSIIRLAQKARAVGIHLVLATQSPRVDVITGMIKANVPSRIAFAVSSQTDSRVILDQNGAESLLGQGDMLFSAVGSSRLQRIQGAYVDEPQIAEITESWRRQGEPELDESLLEEVEDAGDGAGEAEEEFSPDEDPLLEEAILLVASMGTASTSMLQRRLRIGYTRAGRLIDMMERRGIISGYEGSKPRQVLVSEADVPRVLAHLAEGAAPSARTAAGPGDRPLPSEQPAENPQPGGEPGAQGEESAPPLS
jgi:S-DNA-T family DNA segregation ATPase FtsK/SpoIIIE